jgi:hypothetical protein
MNLILVFLKLINGYKTYASAIIAVLAALILLLGGDYVQGIPALVLAIKTILTLATGGAVVSMRMAIAKAEPQPATKPVKATGHLRDI